MPDAQVSLVLVLAVADNGVIGRGNALPWDLPDDLRQFKRITMGSPILMGRKTFDSIGRPLPGRLNLVVTRDSGWSHPGVESLPSIEAAVQRGRQQAVIDGGDKVCVIGGADIYRQCLPFADAIVLTRVHGEVQGDAHFDLSSLSEWQELGREDYVDCPGNSHDFSVRLLQKRDKV